MPAPRYAIELVELSEQPALIIRATVKPDEISAQLADCFGRLVSYIEQAGGAQSGMPFMRYFDMSEDELVIGAGVPLAEIVSEPDIRIQGEQRILIQGQVTDLLGRVAGRGPEGVGERLRQVVGALDPVASQANRHGVGNAVNIRAELGVLAQKRRARRLAR